jgi:5'-3' exonuclease
MKQLLQLKGISVKKALEIVQEYPTLLLLKLAFESSTNPESLLADVAGPALSNALYQLCNRSNFEM